MRKHAGVLILLGLLASLFVADCRVSPDFPVLLPTPVPVPESRPDPAPPPKKPWRPWGEVEATVGGPVSPDGKEEIQCDLPGDLHKRNTGGMGRGGPGTGAGLCVFTSIEHAALHQNVPELLGFQKWMTTRPGGGYPEKVDKMIAAFCKEKGVPVPRYLQVEGDDVEILKLACKTGRMPGVTYCWSPTGRYGGQRIAHMVNLVHASGDWVCVLDNNHPGESRYEWMSWPEFRKTYLTWSDFRRAYTGWSVILLPPGPPSPPTN